MVILPIFPAPPQLQAPTPTSPVLTKQLLGVSVSLTITPAATRAAARAAKAAQRNRSRTMEKRGNKEKGQRRNRRAKKEGRRSSQIGGRSIFRSVEHCEPSNRPRFQCASLTKMAATPMPVELLKQFPKAKSSGPVLMAMTLANSVVYTGRSVCGRVVINTCGQKGAKKAFKKDSKKEKKAKQETREAGEEVEEAPQIGKIAKIAIQLQGREKTHWTESESHGSGNNRRTETIHYYGSAEVGGVGAIEGELVGRNLDQLGMGPGAQAGLSELPINQGRGIHVFNFQLPVPLDYTTAIQTQHGGVSASVAYSIVGIIVGADGKVLHSIQAPIRIVQSQRPPNQNKVTYNEPKELVKGVQPFEFKTSLLNTNVGIGEQAVVEMSVSNHTNWELERVDMTLVSRWQATAKRHRTGHEKTKTWTKVEAKISVVKGAEGVAGEQVAAAASAKSKLFGGKKEKQAAAAALQPLALPNCGDNFQVDPANIIIPNETSPSVHGQIMKVEHVLSFQAHLRDHGAKKGAFLLSPLPPCACVCELICQLTI
jgi:Arrestin (or S-antigen), C-terminal domain